MEFNLSLINHLLQNKCTSDMYLVQGETIELKTKKEYINTMLQCASGIYDNHKELIEIFPDYLRFINMELTSENVIELYKNKQSFFVNVFQASIPVKIIEFTEGNKSFKISVNDLLNVVIVTLFVDGEFDSSHQSNSIIHLLTLIDVMIGNLAALKALHKK